MGTGRIAQVSQHKSPCPEHETNQTEVVHVQSGGSTGEPKQLRRPIETWVTSAQMEGQAFGLSAQDRFAVLGSEHHSLWDYVHFRAEQLAAPCVGLTVSEIAAWSPRSPHQWNAVSPTVLYGVPELVVTLARQLQRYAQPALNVRMLLLGGGPVSPSFPMSLMQPIFPSASFLSFYGTAETSFIGYRRLEAPTYALFPAVELDIRAERDGGGIGEIWVRSPMTITPEAWVNTGDLGSWADGGRLHLLGRANRQLVVKGEKHLVEPLEEALMRQFGLERVALLANSQGQVCCLIADCSGETGVGGPESAHELSLKQVNAAYRDHAPNFPGVRRVIMLTSKEWPNTLAGKTDFVALRKFLVVTNT
jgi:long-chain acyl-CoA synthetase